MQLWFFIAAAEIYWGITRTWASGSIILLALSICYAVGYYSYCRWDHLISRYGGCCTHICISHWIDAWLLLELAISARYSQEKLIPLSLLGKWGVGYRNAHVFDLDDCWRKAGFVMQKRLLQKFIEAGGGLVRCSGAKQNSFNFCSWQSSLSAGHRRKVVNFDHDHIDVSVGDSHIHLLRVDSGFDYYCLFAHSHHLLERQHRLQEASVQRARLDLAGIW